MKPSRAQPLTLDDGSVAVPVAPPVNTGKSQQTIAHNRARRLAEYAQVRDFSQQGWTIKAIAAQVGRNRRTVKKHMQASTFPERQPRRRLHPTLLDPSTASLREQLRNGGARPGWTLPWRRRAWSV